MPRFGVAGWPVAHSRSPAVHAAAYAALGLLDHRYQLLPIPPEGAGEALRALGPAGFAGANVTIPHKEVALGIADEATPEARAIGAANTLTFREDGTVHAANTDAPGLLRAIGQDLRGRTALVLGAGGSGRAAAYALREAGTLRTMVWNRTPERARRLAEELAVEAVAEAVPADVLVHCTSAGLDGSPDQFKDLPVPADALGAWPIVVDLVYRPGATHLISSARQQGCVTVDGLEVLVQQGALSFEAWTGHQAPLDAMRDAARAADPVPTTPT